MANEYWGKLIAKSCDADWRHVSTIPAEMITIGYAEALWADGMLEEGEEGVKG